MLPWTDGIGVTNENRFLGRERANAIRDEPILSPIAAADHIAGSHDGQACSGGSRVWRVEKRFTVSSRDYFRRGLRGAIGIGSAQWIVFSMPPLPSPPVVAFVTGNADDDPNAFGSPHGFQEIDRAADIDVERFLGTLEAAADERLSGQVKNNLGLIAFQNTTQVLRIAEVAGDMLNVRRQSQAVE